MLAAQEAGDDRCGAADDQSFGVNEKPFLFHSRGRRRLRGFHQRLHGPNLLMGSFPDGENKRTPPKPGQRNGRSEEHTSELQSLMRISYAVLCLKKNTKAQPVSTLLLLNKRKSPHTFKKQTSHNMSTNI